MKTFKFYLLAIMLSAANISVYAEEKVDDALSCRGGYLFNKHSESSIKSCKISAEEGNVDSQFALGMVYYYGDVVKQDYKKAFKWIRLSALEGHVLGEHILGSMYHYGLGVTSDYEAALKWYKLSAKEGFRITQYNLGMMYYNGINGVTKNDREAVKWYRLAAEQGHTGAQSLLAWMYYNGEGVIQNYQEAYIWFSLAATGGLSDSKRYRNMVSELIDPKDLKIAQEEAKKRSEEVHGKNASHWFKFDLYEFEGEREDD